MAVQFTVRLHEWPDKLSEGYPWRQDDQSPARICFDVPGKWAICGCCHGNGSHAHAVDGNGLSSEMEQDPEFMEEYLQGAYDKSCEVCGGDGKVIIPDEERFNQDHKFLMEAWNTHCEEMAQIDAIVAAERAMGA